MNNKTDFQKKILKSIAVTGLILAVEAMVLFFIIQAVSKKAEEIAERKILAISFEQETVNFGSMENDYNKINPYLNTIENILPDSDNLVRVLEALNNFGLKVGVYSSVNLESQSLLPSDIDGLNYIPFSIIIDGNYESLRNYLKGFNQQPIFASVESIAFNGQSIFNSARIKLNGKIYTR